MAQKVTGKPMLQKKMKRWVVLLVLRIVLAALCLYLVYAEAGPWTVLFLALLFVGMEALQFQLTAVGNTDAERKSLNRMLARLQAQASGSSQPTRRKW